jgi:hypothetical protein
MGVATQAEQLLLAIQMADESLEELSQDKVKALWQHLSDRGLINIPMKDGYPVSKAGGVFDIISIDGRPGIWLALTAEGGKRRGVLTPAQAEEIDRKRDTGHPATGAIQAVDDGSSSGKCLSEEKYNLEESAARCLLIFKIS